MNSISVFCDALSCRNNLDGMCKAESIELTFNKPFKKVVVECKDYQEIQEDT